MVDNKIHITGTLIWYYYVCKREVWLMGHQINPDEDNPNIALGRFIHDFSYSRLEKRKELNFGHSKIDFLKTDGNEVVVCEVKKSSRHKKSARMQLLFYLNELSELGIKARGELRFPQERKIEHVILDDEAKKELAIAREDIRNILNLSIPPKPRKQSYCRDCGYNYLCWA